MQWIPGLRRHAARFFMAFIALAACGAVMSSPARAQAAPIVMKIGTATLNDSQNEWMKIYAKLVEKDSNGRIKVELYPASQLGNIASMIQGTQFGSIQAYVGPPEFLSGVDARYEALSAPGLFDDLQHANRTLQDPEFNAAFLGLGAKKGLLGIGLFLSGPVAFNTNTPVASLTDLEGKKIRVLASEIQMEQIRRLKGTPIPMSLGEVIPAMQQGTLDGVMSSTPVFTALRFYDAAKYIYDTGHAVISDLTVISKSWYDKLPPDLQKIVTEAGQQASRDVYQWSLDDVAHKRQVWLDAGGKYIEPSADEKVRLMAMMKPIGEKVTAKRPEEKAFFEMLLRAADRNR